MPVKTINGDPYPETMMDSVERFHGNQLVYVGWDHHASISSANCYPLPPQMPFAALLQEVLPSVMAPHPEFSKINWSQVLWLLDGEAFVPVLDKSLAENGVVHKSLLRFKTPELAGYKNSGN
jgi:phenol hydroxylase P4 protein